MELTVSDQGYNRLEKVISHSYLVKFPGRYSCRKYSLVYPYNFVRFLLCVFLFSCS